MRALFVLLAGSVVACASESGEQAQASGGTQSQSVPQGNGGSQSTVPSQGGNTQQNTMVAVGGSTGGASAFTGHVDTTRYFGDARVGNFWIGPVDYEETEFHNACAPSVKYPAAIQQLYGKYLMGVANEARLQGLVASQGQLCDSCAELSANGQTLIAHVITYGEETGPNDIDVSPEVDTVLKGATNRTLTWRFVSCPTAAPVQYTFDGRERSNTWFFRVWIRNARVPVSKVEYRRGSGTWATAEWQSDGAWQAANQDFGAGFSLRVTSIDNQTLEDTLPGLNTFDPDVGIASRGNFL